MKIFKSIYLLFLLTLNDNEIKPDLWTSLNVYVDRDVLIIVVSIK